MEEVRVAEDTAGSPEGAAGRKEQHERHGGVMKTLATVLSVLMLCSGCATAFYVGHGQDQSFKSLAECRLAYPDDTQHCVDRAEYTQASQNTIMLVLNGIGTALLIALTVLAFAHK
jgi:hypothetical protein